MAPAGACESCPTAVPSRVLQVCTVYCVYSVYTVHTVILCSTVDDDRQSPVYAPPPRAEKEGKRPASCSHDMLTVSSTTVRRRSTRSFDMSLFWGTGRPVDTRLDAQCRKKSLIKTP